MFKNYLKIAVRNLKKHRSYSFINITGLTLGMVCCILILLWVQDELSFDRFHTNKAQLYRCVMHLDDGWSSTSSWMLAPTLKKDFPEIEKATRFNNNQVVVKYKDLSFYENLGFADPDFLDMFSFPLLKGDKETALATNESIILTEKSAKKYFQDENPVGKTLIINGNVNTVVTGVIQDIPSNSSLQFDMLVREENQGPDRVRTWYWETTAYVQLAENTSVDDLKEKMAGTNMKYDKRNANEKIVNSLQPFTQIHLYGLNNIGPILYVYIFSSIALIVLIVACINFINLVTAQSSIRKKEIGIRKVAGAGKSQIIGQFYGETLLLSIIAFFIALVLVSLILPAFNTFAEKQLQLNLINNKGLAWGSLGIILLTALIAGSYPALLLSSFRPIRVLKKSTASGSKKFAVRWMLVVLQFAVSIILIVMTLVMSKQMDYIRNKNLGFNKEQIVSINLNDEIRNGYETFKSRLLQYSDIVNVTKATGEPTNIGNVNPVYWEGRGPEQYENINYVTIDKDYIKTFEMQIAEGRDFSEEFSTDDQNYIVNEAAVDFMKMDAPIGKMFSIWQNEGRIIGVVKNFHSRSLHSEIVPVVFTQRQFTSLSKMFIRVNPQNVQATLSHIKSLWNDFVPNYPFEFEFLDDSFQRQYNNEAKIQTLFQYFSLFAIFISCIGLFGLAAFTAQRRTKEIGIRKAIGATVFSLIGLMLKDFVKWLVLAAFIAIPIAWFAMSKWMENFAYKANINWSVFALASIIVFFIAIATVSWQALRAATANPVEALRYE